MPWWMLIIKIVLGIILLLIIAGSGLFGYICFKAQARKWGAGCFAVLALCVALFYLIIFRW